MNRVRALPTVAAVAAAAAICPGCGGGGQEAVVARVAGAAITKAALDHWTLALAPRHELPHNAEQTRELRARALDFLVLARWATGEAAEERLNIAPDVNARIDAAMRGFSSEQEYRDSLRAIGQTAADNKLEASADVARAELRSALVGRQPKPTHAEIAAYYRSHIPSFEVPERRYFYILENMRSRREVSLLLSEITHGKPIAELSLHESLPRTDFSKIAGIKRILYRAIFAAKAGSIAPPLELNGYWFVFEVTRITPWRLQRLPEVRGQIAAKLSKQRDDLALAAFVEAFTRKWTARTDCGPGYVIPRCRQYRGPRPTSPRLSLE